MTDSAQHQGYRPAIYGAYVSQKTKYSGLTHNETEYRQWAMAARHRLKGWFPIDRSIPVLDMGCGAGHFLYLLDRLGYTNLTGVDVSAEQVTLARQACPRATIIHGDVREVLGSNPGRFGLIAGFDIIEHFRKDEILPLLALVAQGLRLGGRLILQTPNAESPWMGSVAYGDFTHEWFFTPGSLYNMLRQVGLIGFEARPCGPYIHGLKSFARAMLWRFLNLLLTLGCLAETGTRGSSWGSSIYTRVFVATAIKG
jgi:cyclopropane fatty-acyl-phospholipid synthase-like methyltransferase